MRFYVRTPVVEFLLKAVFQRFVKLDNFKQVPALASICQMIAEKDACHRRVSSEIGKGSEFWIEIPYQPIHTV